MLRKLSLLLLLHSISTKIKIVFASNKGNHNNKTTGTITSLSTTTSTLTTTYCSRLHYSAFSHGSAGTRWMNEHRMGTWKQDHSRSATRRSVDFVHNLFLVFIIHSTNSLAIKCHRPMVPERTDAMLLEKLISRWTFGSTKLWLVMCFSFDRFIAFLSSRTSAC